MHSLFLPFAQEGDNIEMFLEWAFGFDYDTLNRIKLMKRWNTLHGYKYGVHLYNNIEKDAPIMLDVWRNRDK